MNFISYLSRWSNTLRLILPRSAIVPLFFPLVLVVSSSFSAEAKLKKRWCLAEWKRALEEKVPYKSLPAVSPPSFTSLFQPSTLCHLCFLSPRPCLLHSFIQTHTCSHSLRHTHTLKSVNVTNAVSVQSLLTNRQQLCCECNQAAQCQRPLPQLVCVFFFF